MRRLIGFLIYAPAVLGALYLCAAAPKASAQKSGSGTKPGGTNSGAKPGGLNLGGIPGLGGVKPLIQPPAIPPIKLPNPGIKLPNLGTSTPGFTGNGGKVPSAGSGRTPPRNQPLGNLQTLFDTAQKQQQRLGPAVPGTAGPRYPYGEGGPVRLPPKYDTGTGSIKFDPGWVIPIIDAVVKAGGNGCNGGRYGGCQPVTPPWIKPPPYKPTQPHFPPIDYVRVDPPPYVPPTPDVQPPPPPKPDPVPSNRLPNALLAQSVQASPAIDYPVGTPTPLPAQVADGSIVDSAPHLIVQEAHLAARAIETKEDDARTLFVSALPRAAPAPSAVPRLTGLCINNPVETRASVSYLLNGYEFALRPGQVHQLPSDSYTIEFDMGDDLGAASYELEDGTYNFRVSPDKGWNIFRKIFRVTLDNSTNANDFHFLLNGKETKVVAQTQKEFTSKYPVMVAFDPGDSGAPSRRWLGDGVYKVGIDPRAQLYDLYLASATLPARPTGNPGAPSMLGD